MARPPLSQIPAFGRWATGSGTPAAQRWSKSRTRRSRRQRRFESMTEPLLSEAHDWRAAQISEQLHAPASGTRTLSFTPTPARNHIHTSTRYTPLPELQEAAMKRLTAVLLAAITTVPLFAQTPAAKKDSTPQISYSEYRLPNGLRVIFHEDHSTPIVAVNVW